MQTYSERQKTLNTQHFLNIISRRLSGRRGDKGCEYNVVIKKVDDKLIVDMAPMFYVFPDIHRRSEHDKKNILDWAMWWLFLDEVTYKWNNSVQIVIDDDCFIPGDYIYVKYENANRRKWVNSLTLERAIQIARKETFL